MDKRLLDSISAQTLIKAELPQEPQKFRQPSIKEDNLEQTINGLNSVYPDMTLDDFYVLNSSGFRSDNFTTDHGNKKHVLFAGCSHTFGQGNLLEDVWSRRLFHYLGGYDSLSGYYNVGSPAATYSTIARNILSYIGLYGCPDEIYVLLPDVYREYGALQNIVSMPDQSSHDLVKNINVNSINTNIATLFHAISIIVKNNNSKIFITSNNIYHCSIDGHCFIDPRDMMSDFYPMDVYGKTQELVYEFSVNDSSQHSGFNINAFDVIHDGSAFQYAWYMHFVNILNGLEKANEF